jgi:hypothetical protein
MLSAINAIRVPKFFTVSSFLVFLVPDLSGFVLLSRRSFCDSGASVFLLLCLPAASVFPVLLSIWCV